jgi:hypothetical protein
VTSILRAVLTSALFSAVAVLVHAWSEPYGLFLAVLIVIAMMRNIGSRSRNRAPLITAALVWVAIAWIASSPGNGNEVLISGDTIGSSFLIGSSAFVALMVITQKKFS